MTTIKNITPHAISIYAADGTTHLLDIPPSGEVARVSVTRKETGVVPILTGIPVFVGTYGDVSGLPDPQDGVIYLVSAMVRSAVPTRRDVLSPGELIRDATGQPLGCRGLEANA